MAPKIIWSKIVPIKVLCLVWRVVQQRIPTATALERRGILVNSSICNSCIGNSECANHVLINCPFANTIRGCIWRWCGIAGEHESIQTICDLIDFASNWGRNKRKRKWFVAICYGMIWNLWRFKNKRLFQCESISIQNGLECIKACLLYTSPSPRDVEESRMPSSA